MKTPIITAGSFLLKYHRLIQYPGERTKLINIKTQVLKKNDKLPQYTDNNLSSQFFLAFAFHRLFFSAFNKFPEKCPAGLRIAQ